MAKKSTMEKVVKSPITAFIAGAVTVYALGKFNVLPMAFEDIVRVD